MTPTARVEVVMVVTVVETSASTPAFVSSARETLTTERGLSSGLDVVPALALAPSKSTTSLRRAVTLALS
jgi:hypothetical protein